MKNLYCSVKSVNAVKCLIMQAHSTLSSTSSKTVLQCKTIMQVCRCITVTETAMQDSVNARQCTDFDRCWSRRPVSRNCGIVSVSCPSCTASSSSSSSSSSSLSSCSSSDHAEMWCNWQYMKTNTYLYCNVIMLWESESDFLVILEILYIVFDNWIKYDGESDILVSIDVIVFGWTRKMIFRIGI